MPPQHQPHHHLHPSSQTTKGSTSYANKLNQTFPGYLHKLFRYAQKVRAPLAIFKDLATTTNDKYATIPNKLTTSISRLQLNIWFSQQGGKEFTPTSRPLDTPG